MQDPKLTMDRRYMVGAYLTRICSDGRVWDVHRSGLRSWLLFIPIIGADPNGQGGFAQPEHVAIPRKELKPEVSRAIPV